MSDFVAVADAHRRLNPVDRIDASGQLTPDEEISGLAAIQKVLATWEPWRGLLGGIPVTVNIRLYALQSYGTLPYNWEDRDR